MNRNHKYLADPLETADEAGYTIEDGVVLDFDSKPNARKAWDEWTRYWRPSAEDLRAEEAAWAARSGPVIIKQEGRKSA